MDEHLVCFYDRLKDKDRGLSEIPVYWQRKISMKIIACT